MFTSEQTISIVNGQGAGGRAKRICIQPIPSRARGRFTRQLADGNSSADESKRVVIDYDTGSIVYDFAKDRDWGTNLKYGPYSNSNLAKVVKQCMATDNPNDVFFSDFEPYEASMGEPTQYVASPIFDGKERLGIFAFQLSVAAIDNVMNGNRGWTGDGLGRTGEALIFGSQRRPRSDFRLYLEDPERFLAEQKAQGAPDDVLERIRTFKTTILQLPIDSPAVDLALSGKQGSMIEVHRAGLANFLVSYMPVQIEGLHWAIIARMSTREAFAPMREMRWLFSWWGSGLLVVTVLAALFVTRQILRPVNALVGAAKKVASGDLTAQVAWNSHDELGVLSDTFNSMTRSIREKTELIQEKNRENEALLLNILPGEIAARLKGGEHEIADNFADMGIGLGLLFFVLKGANHLWTSLEGPSIMTQYVTPVIWCFFPGFAALSIPWPLTNWYLRRVGRWEEADGIEDASDSKGGMDSIRIMKWLNIGLVSPIALFTLLAIPIHLSIGDSEVRIGHYASFHTERFPLNEAKRLTMVDGYRLKDGSFRLAKDVIIDFADGRRLRGNQVGDGGSSVRDDVMQLLIAKTGLTPQHALKADDIPVLRAER